MANSILKETLDTRVAQPLEAITNLTTLPGFGYLKAFNYVNDSFICSTLKQIYVSWNGNIYSYYLYKHRQT
jgi:hypothetical protein